VKTFVVTHVLKVRGQCWRIILKEERGAGLIYSAVRVSCSRASLSTLKLRFRFGVSDYPVDRVATISGTVFTFLFFSSFTASNIDSTGTVSSERGQY
jgi:hypothetical protein